MGDYKLSVLMVVTVMLPGFISGARILMVPWEQYSHVNFFTLTGQALQEKGHEVWVLAGAKYEEKLTAAGLKPLVYTPSKQADRSQMGKGEGQSAISMFMEMISVIGNLCAEVMNNKDVINVLDQNKFDLAIMDTFPLFRCFYTIPYKYDIPYISMGAWHDAWGGGVPVLPSIEPSQLLATDIKMTFTQRLLNTFIYIAGGIIQHTLAVGNGFIHEHAPMKPATTFRSLFLDSEMFLISMETTCYEYGRLSTSNYRFIGSLSSTATPKPLPADIEKFTADAQHGVVVISFGSFSGFREIVLPTVKTLIEAFKQMKQKFILQFDESMLDYIPGNVLVLPWLPQNDVLAHPKTKVFITHGGLNGQMESIVHAVPTITIPLQGEQQANGLRAQNRGYGKLLDGATITPEIVQNTIIELIENPKYHSNIHRCSEIIKTLPSPLTSVVFWAEHVIRFGGSHLKQPNADLPFVQYFMLDILAFLLVLDICLCYFAWRCCARPLYRRITRKGSKKSKAE